MEQQEREAFEMFKMFFKIIFQIKLSPEVIQNCIYF